MRKFLIGMITVCIFAAHAVTANAAPSKRTITKAVSLVGKACDNVANVLWRNKGAIAVGTAAVVATTNPEPLIGGAATMVTGVTQPIHQSALGSILFYLLLAVISVAGVRYLLQYLKDWKNWLPLILGLIFCGLTAGIAEAGVIGCATIKPPFWWGEVIGFILLVIGMFL